MKNTRSWPPRAKAALLAAMVMASVSACTGGSTAPSGTVPQQPAPTSQQSATDGQQPTAATQPSGTATLQPQAVPGGAAARTSPGQGSTNPSVRVHDQNSASVVNITSVALVRTPQGASMEAPRGTGSGFVIDDQGRIVTNNHVVEDADQLVATFRDGSSVPAELQGRDPDNDLAAIRVDPSGTDQQGRPVRDKLKPVQLGDSDQIRIGEDAIAIGSPLGLQQTVTAGIVSAIRNPTDEATSVQLQLLGGAIQTDAAINPGNSGGPLFNAAGQVIGVNSAILSQSGGNIGIGFAIPINVVKRVVSGLIQEGCYRHPLVGITSISVSQLGQSLKRQIGVAQNQTGLLVQEVSGTAAQAGIQAGSRVVAVGGATLRVDGDIIVAVDGHEIVDGGQLRAYIENNKRSGDTVTLTVLRQGQRRDIQVTLGERPNDQCR